MLCLDGAPGCWLPAEMPMFAQTTGGLDARIAHAIEHAVQPPGRRQAQAVVLVGMDTPQITPLLLQRAAQITRSADAAFAPAQDGGWWLLGLQRRYALRARPFVSGVPTSTPDTGALQRQRLRDAGLSIGTLRILRDIDTAADVEAVMRDMSGNAGRSEFTRLVRSLRDEAAA
jgi:glycosyltransferase A (GT-A) superfamily protein (DUF2064 family)